MNIPCYGIYKDSGAAWLGRVPDHWTIKKFRYLFTESAEKIEQEIIGPMLSVSGYRGIEIKEYDDDNRRRTHEELIGYRVVRVGQLVVNTMWLNYAGLGVSEYEGHVSPAYRSYFISTDLDRNYVHYLLRSNSYVAGYTEMLTGIRPNSLQLSRENLMSFPVVMPHLSEQRVICTYLDHQTKKIDALVEEQQRLIDLLKEKRQSVISQAVTKGLDASVPMKDSGVEWLGEVPAHWRVMRLKVVAESIKAGPFGSALTKDQYVDSGYRVYGQEQVIPADFSIGDYYITAEKFEELRQYATTPGDILISCVGTFGKIALVPEDIEPGIINPRLLRLRVGSLASPEFLCTVLRSSVTFEQFARTSRGGTMDVINIGTLAGIQIALPPHDEQRRIVADVNDLSSRFETLQAEAEAAIALLQERRRALISAAVTGKVDVRGQVPQFEAISA